MQRTLVLDLDGTLVDSVPDLRASLNRLMAMRGLAGFEAPEVAAMVGDGAAVLVQRAMTARGRQAEAADIGDFLADYGAHPAVELRPFAGVAETLPRLRSDGWRLAVCTNKPEAPARSLLGALRLLDMIDAIGGGDSFPVRKPDPAHLLATIARAGGDPAAERDGWRPSQRCPSRERSRDPLRVRLVGLWADRDGRGVAGPGGAVRRTCRRSRPG